MTQNSKYRKQKNDRLQKISRMLQLSGISVTSNEWITKTDDL